MLNSPCSDLIIVMKCLYNVVPLFFSRKTDKTSVQTLGQKFLQKLGPIFLQIALLLGGLCGNLKFVLSFGISGLVLISIGNLRTDFIPFLLVKKLPR